MVMLFEFKMNYTTTKVVQGSPDLLLFKILTVLSSFVKIYDDFELAELKFVSTKFAYDNNSSNILILIIVFGGLIGIFSVLISDVINKRKIN